MENKYGHFSPDGAEFIITDPDIPRNWYNYFFNDHYVTFTSQVGVGEGFLQDDMGVRLPLVCARAVYLSDGETFWSANALPVEDARDEYACTHGLGYTVIHTKKKGISADYGLFVPCEDNPMIGAEVSYITLRNDGDKEKTVRLVSYTDTAVDTVYKLQGYTSYTMHYDKEFNGMHFEKDIRWNGKTRPNFSFCSCSEPVSHYDCCRTAFLGTYGSVAHPKAMERNLGCTDSDCVMEKFGFILQTDVTLAPGQEKKVVFLTAAVPDRAAADALKARFFGEGKVESELDAVKEKYKQVISGVKIRSPWEDMDKLVNNWLMYLSDMGSRWARVRHNGYRDMTSDTECLGCFNPALAWERIKRVLTYQYSNGYAPRTFLDGAIKDNRFADNTVWLTYTVYNIVMELGDKDLLLEPVKFNDGTEASVYEHLRRSCDWLYHFRGNHDLIRIWGGDWNDSMDKIGVDGKGTSVWLTMAWYRANSQLSELAALLSDDAQVEECRMRGEEIREIVDREGWDSEGYYLYAYKDSGEKVCAHESEGAKIQLNPQLWSILSGIAVGDRGCAAFDKAEELLRRDVGCVVLTPPYTKFDPHIGAITMKAPGTLENGGVYLHTIAWKIAVDAMLGRRDLVEKDVISMLPMRNPVVAGRAEPYILFNSYEAPEAGYRHGTAGQSWRTASGQWFVKALINYVYGLKPHMEGLEVSPCLPLSWKECAIVKQFRGTTYRIGYETGAARDEILVDGKPIEGRILPMAPGKTLDVVVKIK